MPGNDITLKRYIMISKACGIRRDQTRASATCITILTHPCFLLRENRKVQVLNWTITRRYNQAQANHNEVILSIK